MSKRIIIAAVGILFTRNFIPCTFIQPEASAAESQDTMSQSYEKLGSPESSVRCEGIGELKKYLPHDRDVFKRLVILRTDSDPEVRYTLVRAVMDMETDNVAYFLQQVLSQDSEPHIRMLAAYSLRIHSQPDSVKTLINALRDKNSLVRYYALWSLEKITGKDFKYDYQAWMRWQNTIH